jgi:hypothetical protein
MELRTGGGMIGRHAKVELMESQRLRGVVCV